MFFVRVSFGVGVSEGETGGEGLGLRNGGLVFCGLETL